MRYLFLALGLFGGLVVATPVHAAMSCTPSGDACASLTSDRAGAVLRLESFVLLPDAQVCVRRRGRSAGCIAIELRPVRRGVTALYSARLRIPGPSVDGPPGFYTARVLAGGVPIMAALRFRLGGPGPPRGMPALRIASPAEAAIGEPTAIVVTGAGSVGPLRVLLSPVPGGGNCCGIAVAAVRRRDNTGRVVLRFTWPRAYLRCGGRVRCGSVAWGRRGRIAVVSESGRAIATRDVIIRRPRSFSVRPAALGPRGDGEPLGQGAS